AFADLLHELVGADDRAGTSGGIRRAGSPEVDKRDGALVGGGACRYAGLFQEALFLVVDVQQRLDPGLKLLLLSTHLVEVAGAGVRGLDLPSGVENDFFVELLDGHGQSPGRAWQHPCPLFNATFASKLPNRIRDFSEWIRAGRDPIPRGF